MSASVQARPIRVLLVEDNPGDARLILEMLRDVGAEAFDLETVGRLEPALERLGRAAVDVVLLDLGLPDSEGFATFERARAGATDEPIVVISGLDDEQLALRAVRSGAQDYLVKGRIEGQLLARVLRYAIERKHAETALRWLTLAVDQSPASVFITDPHGTIQYVNPRFTEVTGYTAAEAIGQTPRMLKSGRTPPEYYRALWQTILAGETWRGEVQNRRKSGELYWDSVIVSPIRDARGTIRNFLAVQEDVTARKEAAAALVDRDERFLQLAENITEMFFIVDAAFRETLYISPAYERIWGRSIESLYQRPASFLEGVQPEDQARVRENITRVQQGRDPGEIEFQVRRPDGEDRWVLVHAVPIRNVAGQVYRIAGVALDITRRRDAEAALRESERRARTLFDTVHLIVLGLDARGNVEYVNPYFLELSGYARDEVIGQPWVERFLPQRDQAELTTTFRELLERELHAHYENPILTKSGAERMIAWNNTVLRDAQGRPAGTLSIGEDITDRLQLEAQYRQAQKMEAVGRLAGGVAHDFNNVLTAIFGYIDLMGEELAPDSPARADLEEIRHAATRAATLTRQLLAFSRQQVLQPVVLNPNDVLDNLRKMLGRLLGEDIDLDYVFGRDLGNVKADAGQLEQVILNLAVNARDAMPAAGKLTVETANAELDASYAEQHRPVEPGRYVIIAVSDTGTGMDEATQARIFEPFFTTKEKGKGTGLGLATVYGIVKQSGGYIWVYSEPGHGSTFKVYLPRVDEPTATLAPAPPLTVVPTGSETVLLAEDDDLLRPLARDLLRKLGYTVLEAANATEALALARAHAGPIHLLVSDVVMPGESGLQLAGQLQAARPSVKVLYMSGYTDDAVVRHGLLEPGRNYLQKPFTPAVLASKVRAVLDGP